MSDDGRWSLSDKPADEYLTLVGHARHDIGELADGSLIVVVRLDGRPMSLMDEDVRYGARRSRHSGLRSLFDINVTVFEHHVCHDRVPEFDLGDFRSGFGRDLMTDYHAALGQQMYAREWYCSIVVRPRPAEGFIGKLNRMLGRDVEVSESLLRQADEKAAAVLSTLRDYSPRRLGTRWQGGVAYSEIGEAMRLVLYGRWAAVPIVRGPLAGAIYTDRVVCGLLGFEVRHATGSDWGVMIGFRDYPEQVRPSVLDCLLSGSARIVMTNRFEFRSATRSTGSMAKTQRQMDNSRDRAKSLSLGLHVGMDDVESGRKLMGDHHWSLAIHADSRDQLARAIGEIKSTLSNSSNVATAVEAMGTFAAYWGQVPGASASTRARHGLISGQNFCSFSSLGGTPSSSGMPHWGRLFRLITSSYTAHDFDPHVRRVAHTLIVGPTGFGKSTFLGFVATALEQSLSAVGGLCVILDKDGSSELTVLAAGGNYLRIEVGDSKMAPLKALRDTRTARWWMTQFLIGLIMADGGPLPPSEQRERLGRAVDFVARRPPELRWIGGIRQFLDHGNGSTGSRLDQWCRGGALGWVFDNAEDHIDLDAGIVGIDNTQILPDEMITVRGPAAAYQFYRIRERIGLGVRGAVLVDEMASYLPDSRFSAGFDAFSRELRKGNGMLWMAVHHPEDLERTPVGQTLLANTPTKILFPNPYAKEAKYRDLLKCSAGEIEAIVDGLVRSGEGTFMIKRPEGSYVVRAPLDKLPHHIAILSSDPNRSRLWHSISQRHRGDPAATRAEYGRRYQEANH